jgi:hypothetical protein
MIICKYRDMVFMADKKKGTKLINTPWIIAFLNFFDGDDESFISTYKNHYPNSALQVYKHPKKALFKSIKIDIEDFLDNNQPLKQEIRNRKLQKVLNFEKI